MSRRKQAKVYITEVNVDRRPPLARAREVVSGGSLTISLDINRNQTPKVGEIWWVQYLGTRWALYAKVSDSADNTSGEDDVSSTTLDLFFQVREQATKLSYYPLVKFNSAKVSGDPANVSHYIISWTKCTKNGNTVRNEKAQQYTWNPNETADGADSFVDIGSGEGYDYSVEIPFEIDNPKTSYYKARIRAVSKANATKGAWSPWTKPKLPIRNSLNGPPPVEDVELNFAVRETNNGKLDYRAIVRFKDIGYWDIPGYDFEDDVSAYDVQLQPLEKRVKTYGTLTQSFNKTAATFIVKEKSGSGLPSSLRAAFDVQIGNEIIGIASRSGAASARTFKVATRGKYSTVAVNHAADIAVKEYDLYAYDLYSNLVPVDEETIPALRGIVTNKTVLDRDQDGSINSWPRIAKLNADITAAQTSFNTAIINEELLKNLPTSVSPFSTGSYLFKIAIKKEVIGITEWSYNTGTKILHLEGDRGIDSTQADDYDQNVKVKIDSWLSVGYLQSDITEESDTITIVEDRILDLDSNNDGINEDFTIRIEDEMLQVYSRNLIDTLEIDNKTYYVYEYEVYRGIQNTEVVAHSGSTNSIVEIDLGYYYSTTFESIPKPKQLYWKARVRAIDRFNRNGPWSDWTDPLKASEDADILAPAPTGVALNFNRKHRNRGWSISARVSWDKVRYEIPGGDTVDDVKGYQPRLMASDGSKLSEPIGFDIHTVTSRYLTDNIAYLVLDPTNLTEYSFSAGQLIEVLTTTIDGAERDEVYNGTHRVLDYNTEDNTVAFYKAMDNDLDLEETQGNVTTPQTIIRVYEPDKTNSTQRQLGTEGTGYIFLTSFDLPQDVAEIDATNASYYEMMYVKDSWKSLTEDYYEYFVARGVMGTTPRDFNTQWMTADVTEPIKPMLVFTYPAAFEATKLVDSDEQELEPAGGIRYSQNFGPVRRQYWYVGQVRTLSTSNLVGAWSKPSSPATALDNVRPPQPFNINVIPYNNYVKVDWDIQAEPGVFVPTISADADGELNPDDFEIISSDVSYFKVQLWSEDPHAEAPDEQQAFGLSGNPSYDNGTVTLYLDQSNTAQTIVVGDTVVIKGCWPTVINGQHVVTAVDSNSLSIQVDLSAFPITTKPPYQIDGMVFKKGARQALDLYKQYPIHFFRATSLTALTKLRLAEKGDICQVSKAGKDNGYYELTQLNYRLLSNWKKVKKQNVQIPGLLFYDRYVNLTSRNVPVKKLTNKVWARVCSVDEAGNQSEWIAAGPFNTEFIPGPDWVLTLLKHQQNAQLDAKVKWAEITSPDFNIGSYNIELQQGRLYAQLYNDSMDFWGLDPTQDIVVGMLSDGVTAESSALTLNVTEFGESADENEYIKIGDEIFKVTHREASDDINGFIDAVYTVERGSIGTTPATHATGALILKVQSEAIIVRELFTPAFLSGTAGSTAATTFDIVIGNEKMRVLERVAYGDQSALTISSTSPTFNPASTWSTASSAVIGTIGSSSSSQTGSSSLLFSSPNNSTATAAVWIAATSTGIWTSSDLISWTASDTTPNLRSIGYADGIWVVVGDGGNILTTSDPLSTWTLNSSTPFGTDDIYSVKYGNGIWTIAGENSRIATTINPVSDWTLIETGLNISLDVFDKSINGSTVTLVITENTNISTGSIITVSGLGEPYDGSFTATTVSNVTVPMTGTSDEFAATQISYSVSTTGSESLQAELALPPVSIGVLQYGISINSLTYGAGYWAVACDEGIIATAINPSETWTAVTTPTSVQLNSIAYANGYWVAVGSAGTILTAVNPTLTWTTVTSGISTNLFDVNYGSGKWVAVGASGKILTTSNPTAPDTNTAWVTTTSGSSNLYSISYGSEGTPSTWIAAGTNGLVIYANSDLGSTTNYNAIGNLWVYLVLRDRTWGSNLGQIEDFQHPDLTPIFDSIADSTATREGAIEADRDNNDYWDYTFTNVPATFFYRSRVQGVLKSGVKGNWSHYTLWANPNDLTAPQTPLVDADFDAKVLNISWTMPNNVQNQIFKVDDQEEMLALDTAEVGDIAIYSVTTNNVTVVYAYRLSALPASTLENWQVTLSPIDDQGNTIDIANDYLYQTDAAAFYQVQVSRIPKKWEAAGSLGRLLKNLEQGTGSYTFDIDPGQKLDKYPKVGNKIKIGAGPLIQVSTVKNGLNEVQKIQLLRNPTGNFKLSFRGATTGNLVTTSSASAVQSALIGLSTIPTGGVTVSKPNNTTWIVKFTGSLATQRNIPQIVPNSSGLTTSSGSYGANEVMTITSCPSNPEDWQKAKVSITVNRDQGAVFHAKGAVVQWVKQDDEDFYDPKKPFAYKWLWKDEKFVTEMSRSYTADRIKQYLFTVRVRAADAAGNFSDWATEFVSPSGVPTPDVTSLEFTDVDNTPDTLEGVLTFTGSMDPTENIDNFVTELMPTQQMRILNKMSTASTKIFVKRKNKVLNPSSANGIGSYTIYLEDEQLKATARTEVTFKGVSAYRLDVQRAQNNTVAAAHDKGAWAQWFHHFTVKETISGVAYNPSLDATVDADGGTIISDVPPIGEYKTVFNGIKAGRWYKGRAKAVTDDGKSSSWSDWSLELRGAKGASTNGSADTAAGPNPVRNLTMDVDQQKIHVFWIEPKPRETSGSADSFVISSIVGSTADSTAVVTTSVAHGFTAGSGEDDPADDVTISGAYAPFNGTFTVSAATTYTFTIPVEFGADDPTAYPLENADIEGDANYEAVVTLAGEENNNNNESEIDHYIVSIKGAKLINGSTSPTWTTIKAGSVINGWKTDNNVKTTSKTFKLQSPTSDLPYYARVIAVNADGTKSEARYARNSKLKPPKPTIDSITISAAKTGNKYVAKIKLIQNRVVTDKEITKYRIEYFWSNDKDKDPSQVDSVHTSSTPASRIQEGKKIRIGHLPFKKFLFVRIASQNSVGKHSNWTKWRRKKIVTKTN